LPDTIRFSETFTVPLSELVHAVRRHGLEGIVAKRIGSLYRSGERCGDWLKWRANRAQEFVIGGYVPGGTGVESILVGYYIDRKLMYAARVRAGLSTNVRRVLLPFLEELQIRRCPFANCPTEPTGAGAKGSLQWHECSCPAVAIELLRRAGS